MTKEGRAICEYKKQKTPSRTSDAVIWLGQRKKKNHKNEFAPLCACGLPFLANIRAALTRRRLVALFSSFFPFYVVTVAAVAAVVVEPLALAEEAEEASGRGGRGLARRYASNSAADIQKREEKLEEGTNPK